MTDKAARKPRGKAVRKPRQARGKARSAGRAGSRSHGGLSVQGGKPVAAPPKEPIDPDRYPNLAALEAWDREMHVRAAMGMGLTRKQAERHVEDELAGAHLA